MNRTARSLILLLAIIVLCATAAWLVVNCSGSDQDVGPGLSETNSVIELPFPTELV